MSDRSRIYVDLDDVLCETGRAFTALLDRYFDRRIEFEEISSFDLGRSFGLEPEELEEFMRRAHHPDELRAIQPVAGAVGVLADWVTAGYQVEVVTGRPPSTRNVSREWLHLHRVPHHALTFVDKYARSPSTAANEEVVPLRALSPDFCLAVEDSLRIALHLAGRLGVPVALFDRPWNRLQDGTVVAGLPIVRCRDWAEVVDRFPRP